MLPIFYNGFRTQHPHLSKEKKKEKTRKKTFPFRYFLLFFLQERQYLLVLVHTTCLVARLINVTFGVVRLFFALNLCLFFFWIELNYNLLFLFFLLVSLLLLLSINRFFFFCVLVIDQVLLWFQINSLRFNLKFKINFFFFYFMFGVGFNTGQRLVFYFSQSSFIYKAVTCWV